METEKQKIKYSFTIALLILAPMWIIHIIRWIAEITWPEVSMLGILPRNPAGLLGIFTSPFIHGDWNHLISNSGPILVLSAGIVYFYKAVAFKTFAWIYVLTGFWVWLFAEGGSHIGASGLLYGFAAFLFFSGIFRRDTASIALALVIAFFYGGLVWGIFPGKEGISWEAHLFGGMAGTVFAWHFRGQAVRPRKRYGWEDEPDGPLPGEENAYWNYNSQLPLPTTIEYSAEHPNEE